MDDGDSRVAKEAILLDTLEHKSVMIEERLNMKEFSEDDKVGLIKHGFPKKMYDPGNYVFLVKINDVVEMVALVDTGAS
nr:hypothetical protein [Tanacetum cinerariifolium]